MTKPFLIHFFCFAEDDEFEEFDPAHWNKDSMEEETQQQWMESWDDDMDVSCLYAFEHRDAERQIFIIRSHTWVFSFL